MEIYLIRHTTPKVEKGTCYGHSDLELIHSFEEEFESIRKVLPEKFEIPLFSSPLQRCATLAQHLKGYPLKMDERLKELHYGDWEMKPWNAIYPDELSKWRQNLNDTSTPNGESFADLKKRVLSFWDELITSRPAQAGLVTHYGVIQSLIAHVLHIPLDKVFQLDIPYGSVIRVVEQREGFYKIKFLK